VLYVPDLQMLQLCLFCKFTFEETLHLRVSVTKCSVSFMLHSQSVHFTLSKECLFRPVFVLWSKVFESRDRIVCHIAGLVIASPQLHQLLIVSVPVRCASP
jgi:hypothetical protein